MRVCCSISQGMGFHTTLLTTEKVADYCKVKKLVDKCSRKNCLKLKLFDCEKVLCVVVEL